MKLSCIIKANNVIEELSKKDVNAQLAYVLAKFLTKTNSDIDFYRNQFRILFSKHNGEVSEDGTMKIAKERVDDFNKDVTELENTEAEDPGVRIPLTLLTQELKLSAQQMCQIIDFVDETK